MTKSRRRRHPLPLAVLNRKCRSAAVVWVALQDMASERGSHLVTPTREELMTRTGISRTQTISKALTALDKAGWIERNIVRQPGSGGQFVTLLRVVLLRTQQKTHRTDRTSVRSGKRTDSTGRKTPLDSSKEERGAAEDGAAPSLKVGASPGRPHEHPPTIDRIAQLEDERLASIREGKEVGGAAPVDRPRPG